MRQCFVMKIVTKARGMSEQMMKRNFCFRLRVTYFSINQFCNLQVFELLQKVFDWHLEIKLFFIGKP